MIDLVAGPDDAGERVDVLIATRSGISRSLVQRALNAGSITIGGRVVAPSYRVAEGDVISGPAPVDPRAAGPEAEAIPLEVLYSDERVLVVSKPAGLVSHPAGGHPAGTLVNALLGLGGPLAGAGSARPGIVHRLDKDTSGALLVAKDDDAHAHLVAALKARHIERRYWAFVKGDPQPPSGTVDAPLGRHEIRRRLVAVVPDGRPAVTHYRVVERSDAGALLDVTLETGRTHQIRVHLAYIGHPVLGDRTYGGGTEAARRLGLARPFLHARRLTFPHPDGTGPVTVTAPLPDDLTAALATAGIPTPST